MIHLRGCGDTSQAPAPLRAGGGGGLVATVAYGGGGGNGSHGGRWAAAAGASSEAQELPPAARLIFLPARPGASSLALCVCVGAR